MSIQRWEHDERSDCYGMKRAADGDYVRYDDHESALLSARRESEALADALRKLEAMFRLIA